MQNFRDSVSDCVQTMTNKTSKLIGRLACLLERNKKQTERRTYYEKKYQHVSTKQTVDALKKWREMREAQLADIKMKKEEKNPRTYFIEQHRLQKDL
jgi:hypothetical protein